MKCDGGDGLKNIVRLDLCHCFTAIWLISMLTLMFIRPVLTIIKNYFWIRRIIYVKKDLSRMLWDNKFNEYHVITI
jgi:hypothetical protein